jgi:hypothetical protein
VTERRLKSLEDILDKLIVISKTPQLNDNYGQMIAKYNAIYRDITGEDYKGVTALKMIEKLHEK